jgi:response regulator of citrate/malate metabolism
VTEFPVPLRKEERMVRDITVFIVEDDPMVLDIHRRFLLSVPGFRVVGTAGNGARALDFLSRTAVDLVILDIFMPEMDGLEVVERLRAVRKSVDVIIISAAHEAGVIKDVVSFRACSIISSNPSLSNAFRAALDAYRDLMRRVQNGQGEFSQETSTASFSSGTARTSAPPFPKGSTRTSSGESRNCCGMPMLPFPPTKPPTGAGISRSRPTIPGASRRHRKAENGALLRRGGRPLNKYRLLP